MLFFHPKYLYLNIAIINNDISCGSEKADLRSGLLYTSKYSRPLTFSKNGEDNISTKIKTVKQRRTEKVTLVKLTFVDRYTATIKLKVNMPV
ncbi:hypothetical protein N752_25745 [Desulforamulus aquiferis]|nr:hypothetical protein N752_25745 [Desulforamulus aquiferis]